jgi:hypothetical protein
MILSIGDDLCGMVERGEDQQCTVVTMISNNEIRIVETERGREGSR